MSGNNLLHLFNISHFSSLCCAKNFSLLSCTTERMAKKMQEQKDENRIVAKSRQRRWTWPVLFIQVLHLWTVRLRLEARRYSKLQFDRLAYQKNFVQARIKIPIPTQRLVPKDGKGTLNFSSALVNLWQLKTKDVQKILKLQKIQNTQNPKVEFGHKNFHISPDCVPHMEKVFSIVRRTYDRKPTDNLKDLDVNTAMWCKLMSVTLKAAVHLGQDYSQNIRSIMNQPSKSVDQLFRTTEKLIKDHTEIAGLSTIDWNQPTWKNHLHCVIELFKLWNPKPTSFPNRCYVWEALVLYQSKHGKTKLNGIWRHAISKIWIELMESRWNSNGHFSQDSQHWEF